MLTLPQLRQLSRFGEIGISAEPISFFDIRFEAGAAENNCRNACESRLLPEPLEDFEAIHARHFQVQHDNIRNRVLVAVCKRTRASQILDKLLSVVGCLKIDLDAGFGDDVPQEFQIVWIILGCQDDKFLAHFIREIG